MGHLGAFTQSRKAPNTFACLSVCLSVCLYGSMSAAPIGKISLKFHIGDFHKDLLRKSKFD
jgi:hypothetical protein